MVLLMMLSCCCSLDVYKAWDTLVQYRQRQVHQIFLRHFSPALAWMKAQKMDKEVEVLTGMSDEVMLLRNELETKEDIMKAMATLDEYNMKLRELKFCMAYDKVGPNPT